MRKKGIVRNLESFRYIVSFCAWPDSMMCVWFGKMESSMTFSPAEDVCVFIWMCEVGSIWYVFGEIESSSVEYLETTIVFCCVISSHFANDSFGEKLFWSFSGRVRTDSFVLCGRWSAETNLERITRFIVEMIEQIANNRWDILNGFCWFSFCGKEIEFSFSGAEFLLPVFSYLILSSSSFFEIIHISKMVLPLEYAVRKYLSDFSCPIWSDFWDSFYGYWSCFQCGGWHG